MLVFRRVYLKIARGAIAKYARVRLKLINVNKLNKYSTTEHVCRYVLNAFARYGHKRLRIKGTCVHKHVLK